MGNSSLELVSETSNDSYSSNESKFHSSFDLLPSAFTNQSRSYLDINYRDSLGDGKKTDVLQGVSTIRLSFGCQDFEPSASESEVYFQKINASIVFPEDYKCRPRRKKCGLDYQIKSIFSDNYDDKYSKLIAEAKKRQRCGPCLTREKCSCGDATTLRTIEQRVSAKTKTEEMAAVKEKRNLEKLNSEKQNKMKKGRRKSAKSKNKSDSSKQQELSNVIKGIAIGEGEHNDQAENERNKEVTGSKDKTRGDLTRPDSVSVIKDRMEKQIDRHPEAKVSEDELDDENRTVKVNTEPEVIPETIPEKIFVPALEKTPEPARDKKTTSFRIRLKTKSRPCPGRCHKPYARTSMDKFQKSREQRPRKLCTGCNSYRDNGRKVVKDAASCIPAQGLKEVATNTATTGITITCRSTQTCRRQAASKACPFRRTIALDPIDEIDDYDKQKILDYLDDLIEEFEKMYEEEKKKIMKRKKKCLCKASNAKSGRRKPNCTCAYLTMTKPYMPYETLLTVEKSYSKSSNTTVNLCGNDRNKNLLRFLALKRKQLSCFGGNIKRTFSFTEDDARKFEKEFSDFFMK